jgi:purine nucleosidase
MRRSLLFLMMWTALLPLANSCVADQKASSSPPNVIFDTDIWSDIDDMLALAMLHALHDRHEINLVAVTVSTNSPWSATYVDLMDTFYHHSQVPVGLTHDLMLEELPKRFPSVTEWPLTRYTEIISQRRRTDGSLIYPRALTDGRRAPEAVSLLRKTLAAQPDGSTIVVLVGYSNNLARLLDSKPDSASPLEGRTLVSKKVRFLSVMAGDFGDGNYEGTPVPIGSPEANLVADVSAAQMVFSRWPTPIVASGAEIGLAMPYPGSAVLEDFSYVEHHPVAETYTTYCEEIQHRHPLIHRCPQDHDHATSDLTAVLYAARPDQGYFSLSPPGTITVLADGGSRFTESSAGSHRHLIIEPDQRARTLEAMRMLVSQPSVLHN